MKRNQPLVVVGHCGARGLAPGNTMASFQKALDFDVDAIETDLCATRDGVIVLLHEPVITDPSGVIHNLAEVDFAQVKQWLPDVVRLEELIEMTHQKTRLMLEVKEARAIVPTIEIIETYLGKGWQASEFIITSFDFATLRALRAAFPQIDIVVLKRRGGISSLWQAQSLRTKYLCVDIQRLRPGFLHFLAGRYRVYAYTPQLSKRTIRHQPPEKLIQAGLYGVITDFPNYFR